ncbi:hypothetical protein HK101_012016, partial [Irineochytrium annulatum]
MTESPCEFGADNEGEEARLMRDAPELLVHHLYKLKLQFILDPNTRVRGLHASTPFPRGDIILVNSAIASSSLADSCCSVCFITSQKLSRCSKCHRARYCSQKCQRWDWAGETGCHKVLCPVLTEEGDKRDAATIRDLAMVMQLELCVRTGGVGARLNFAKAARVKEEAGWGRFEYDARVGLAALGNLVTLLPGDAEGVSKQEDRRNNGFTESDRARKARLDWVADRVADLSSKLPPPSTPSSSSAATPSIPLTNNPRHLPLQNHARILSNAFVVSLPSPPSLPPQQVESLFPLGSLLNHSCAPTAIAIHCLRPRSDAGAPPWQLVQIIRAIRDLKAGEEVTLAYVDPLLPPG